MTDDLVARLRSYNGAVWETTACYNGLREEAAANLEAAEARVRELEAERDKWDRRVAYDELQAREHENRATQQHQIDALTIRAEAAERALAEAYERCAKVAETEGAYPELNVWAGGPEWYRHGLRIATAIRKLAQEVKHEAE